MSSTVFRPRRLPDVLALSLWLVPVLDMLIVLGAAAALSVALTWWRDANIWPWTTHYQAGITFAVVLTPLIFFRFDLYRSYRGEGLAVELTRLTAAWLVVAASLVAVAVASKTSSLFSRVWMVSWVGSTLGLLWASRIVVRLGLAWLRQRGWDTREILLIGDGRAAERVAHQLDVNRWTGYRIRGYFAHDPERPPTLGRLNCLGSVDRLEEYVTRIPRRPDQVWIVMTSDEPPDRLRRSVAAVGRTLIDCRLVPSMLEFSLLNYSVTQVAGLPVLDLSRSPMSGLNRLIKAAEDRALAALIVTLAAPLMLCIALGVKLSSPGPVLFRQKRHGWNGEEITVLKFRTMEVHSELPGQVTQARRADPRVTPLGAFLRRTSLDELPQFFNVLGGTMSVVGPRPHAIEHNRLYKRLVEGYMLRHKVKPGITGWAQVNGLRGETDTLDKMQRRVEYDLYYIEHWSLWLDLAIVVLTLMRGFISPRAY
ncbi:MAG: undecaprenyl-phosphate glucose phosphotransferase [Nevskiales bacterium]